jgi:hypothetical protein
VLFLYYLSLLGKIGNIGCGLHIVKFSFILVVFLLNVKVACETNEELRGLKPEPSEGFDIGKVLQIARRSPLPPSFFFKAWERLPRSALIKKKIEATTNV